MRSTLLDARVPNRYGTAAPDRCLIFTAEDGSGSDTAQGRLCGAGVRGKPCSPDNGDGCRRNVALRIIHVLRGNQPCIVEIHLKSSPTTCELYRLLVIGRVQQNYIALRICRFDYD